MKTTRFAAKNNRGYTCHHNHTTAESAARCAARMDAQEREAARLVRMPMPAAATIVEVRS